MAFAASISTAGEVDAVRSEQGVLFAESGHEILFYQQEPKSFEGQFTRNNYIHPLWNLKGDVITEDAPQDHLHQRGIFWAWHQVAVGDVKLGDAWECRDFIWDVVAVKVEEAAGGAKQLVATVLWRSPKHTGAEGLPTPLVRETTRVTVHPQCGDVRLIDFDVTLMALVAEVTIGGSEDAKGYGGFSLRLVCPEDLKFLSGTGPVEPTTEAVQAGCWLDLSGSFAAGDLSGVGVLVHPRNPVPRDQWILRRSRSMQNAVYPGRNPVGLSQVTPLRLRYRLVLHPGRLTGAAMESLYQAYAAGAVGESER